MRANTLFETVGRVVSILEKIALVLFAVFDYSIVHDFTRFVGWLFIGWFISMIVTAFIHALIEVRKRM
ncbi:MAG: hypothetical protein ACUVQF_09810 [Fervidobacterium sp.]|uniref:hypothetical protein n=1 Tax=Fervidobacterium sp. TaxID=1871331 RepID=UPI004049942B